MNSITAYIKSNYRTDKSLKSLWNIVVGARTQQTYFDAAMQQLLPVYELSPSYPLHKFEEKIKALDDNCSLKLYPYFYLASEVSFQALRLLVQTSSELSYHNNKFMPVSSDIMIQRQVKRIVHEINPDQLHYVRDDLKMLVDAVHQKFGHNIFIYQLSGNNTRALNDAQLARSLNIETHELKFKLFIEKNFIIHLLRNAPFKVFNQLYYRVPLHKNTLKTYRLIHNNDIEATSKQLKLRTHTIQDHIIEMIIKDYEVDIMRYIDAFEMDVICEQYKTAQYGKLKTFYVNSQVDDYFKLKLGITKASISERSIYEY
ncbi:helix-turn-helix domain-containing protein [Macrococcus armenti]|uniref:helix-turn-helix domain-containing protein n=1 Tax=Macrococcus armenti TaxID=2875764 RepID=UPI001CCD2761|nr:helix-turn-helix domain-containing protein [Macrococcus armenti]UBH12233.1 helix-turn-helix domain-containing protein [Macrococcus armenti]UBH21376.1 helix-turn-helix domain-containing protein [Macrococcus armenti]